MAVFFEVSCIPNPREEITPFFTQQGLVRLKDHLNRVGQGLWITPEYAPGRTNRGARGSLPLPRFSMQRSHFTALPISWLNCMTS
jgi:hypothetical protein